MRISSVYDREQTDAKILTCLASIIPWALYVSPVAQVVHARCRFVLWLQKYVCSTNIRGKAKYSDSSILDDRLQATQRTMAWTTEATMSEKSSPEFRAQKCVDDRVYRRARCLQNYTPKNKLWNNIQTINLLICYTPPVIAILRLAHSRPQKLGQQRPLSALISF